MPRLTNAAGVVVNVDDATAERLGSDWKPVDAKPAKETAAQKRKREAEEKAEQGGDDNTGEAGPE